MELLCVMPRTTRRKTDRSKCALWLVMVIKFVDP